MASQGTSVAMQPIVQETLLMHYIPRPHHVVLAKCTRGISCEFLSSQGCYGWPQSEPTQTVTQDDTAV